MTPQSLPRQPEGPPEGIPQDVWDTAVLALPGTAPVDLWMTRGTIARAIMAEREHWAEAMKNPAAVRVNYLRGTIACQGIIDEAVARERERWQPAIAYFNAYCLDEEEDARNCVCGDEQHEAAKRFGAVVRGEAS